MKEDLLCRKFCPEGKKERSQILLPEKLQKEALEQLHNAVTAGHMGVRRTLASVEVGFSGQE